MHNFWTACGHQHLRRDTRGWMSATPDYWRLWLQRPELALVPESCQAEKRLHKALLDNPLVQVECVQLPGDRNTLGGIVRAIADAEADFGITGRLIAAIDREAPPAAATEMVEWVLAHRREEVIGIGIDYREVDHPPEWFAPAYALARRGGLKTTAHAGEFGMPWHNVRTALDLLKVDRIDHGYTVVDNPAFARECAERGGVETVVRAVAADQQRGPRRGQGGQGRMRSAGGFDTRIERQKVGLEGDLVDHIDDLADLAGCLLDAAHGGHGIPDDGT